MYRVRLENSLPEIEKRAALGSTSQCSQCCPLIHFLWVILWPNSVESKPKNHKSPQDHISQSSQSPRANLFRCTTLPWNTSPRPEMTAASSWSTPRSRSPRPPACCSSAPRDRSRRTRRPSSRRRARSRSRGTSTPSPSGSTPTRSVS